VLVALQEDFAGPGLGKMEQAVGVQLPEPFLERA